jgi:NAD(P)-dependent dehydrogenase (short-subunit alcohol dehydrogenase family)
MGKATSVLFAREGARVLLVDRVTTPAEATLAAIRDEGGDASVREADGTTPADCQGMVETVRSRYGRLDILVNNVGIVGPGSVMEVKEEDWDRVLDVNLKSMMLTSKYAIPAMLEGGGASLPYAVSKGGVIALTTQMAMHHGRDHIRVNGIAPGHIYTPMVAAGMTGERRDLRRRAGPLGTEGTAWDIAWAAVFLASDEVRWITGVVLPVDAGLLATTPLAMLRHLR